MRRVAVGREAVALGCGPHQRAGDGCADDGEGGEHEIGLTPAEMGDQLVRQGRADQRADADARDGDAACGAAAAHEPALHGGHARHVAEADAHADAEPVADVDLPQAFGLGGGDQADGDQQQAADHDGPGAGAIGDQAGREAEQEIEEGRDREDQRGLAAARAELAFQRAEEGGEGIGDGIAGQHAEEGAGDHPPAGKDALLGLGHAGKLESRGMAGHGQWFGGFRTIVLIGARTSRSAYAHSHARLIMMRTWRSALR